MTDPLRVDRLPNAADVPERDRDARIEELLLAGLDRYFSGEYELAINVWTRVLFIDRGHARARAYIERARTAVAERQRQGDELLHTGSVAVDRGDAGAARALIASAVEHGAPADEALALMARIDRLETAAPPPRPLPAVPSSASSAVRAGHTPGGLPWRWIGAALLAGVLLGAAVLGMLLQRGLQGWPFVAGAAPAPLSTLNAPLPVPSVGEMALSRGQALHAQGRLHDALAALAAVPLGDPHRARADELTGTIQRQLLAATRPGAAASQAPAGRRP
jgi:hypothetical protein